MLKRIALRKIVLGFRPVSVLFTISKIFYRVIENYLMKSMVNHLPFSKLSILHYSTEHVILLLTRNRKKFE